ncbi:MAG: AAA family ATPase [Gammaproteobacteria bacterium]|nr:AAA family ATPase [Gammaproteobacteria bacterium]
MLNQLDIENFTVFHQAQLCFSSTLNVFIGENGTGKTHLLKLLYSLLMSNYRESNSSLEKRLVTKLKNIFKPESVGRLATRQPGKKRCKVSLTFDSTALEFSFANNTKTGVKLVKSPSSSSHIPPIYIPTRELLTIYPNFASVYNAHILEFEEIWYDTCLLLGNPLKRGAREEIIGKLCNPLEDAMKGKILLDKNGRFYIRQKNGASLEMPLVAEGLRKFAMLAYLIANGSLQNKSYLFWDEPEANLNSRLIKQIAKTLADLSAQGIQVFIATHSLFLLREIEILAHGNKDLQPHYFGLHDSVTGGVTVKADHTLDGIGNITALEESLQQSDRYIDMGV